MTQDNPQNNRVKTLAAVLMVLQAVLQCVWHLLLHPANTPAGGWLQMAWLAPSVILAVLVLLHRRGHRALFWAGMWNIVLFCHGISEAYSDPNLRLLGVLEILLAIGVILVLGKDGKRRKKAIKAQKAAAEAVATPHSNQTNQPS